MLAADSSEVNEYVPARDNFNGEAIILEEIDDICNNEAKKERVFEKQFFIENESFLKLYWSKHIKDKSTNSTEKVKT